MDASIIIPSYNSKATIDHCLRALQTQQTDYSYETIVVDSSDDGTNELIASRFPAVQLICCPQRTPPGVARNLGIQQAEGTILAFTDADCIPEPRWLHKMLQAHSQGSFVAVGGSIVNGLPLNPVAWSDYLLEFNERLPHSPKGFVDFMPTCNVSFKRTIFERYGLFPDLWTSEDMVFCLQLIRAGEQLLFEPTIQIRHLSRSHLKQFLRHQRQLGRGSAVARRQFDLPQAWVVNHPLRCLTPLMRLIRIEMRLAHWDRANFFRFNLLAPLCLSGLIAWGIGFCSAKL